MASGTIIEEQEYRVFIVQSTYPTGRPDDDIKFRDYVYTAYTDISNPGTSREQLFTEIHSWLCKGRMKWKGGRPTDALVFSNEDEALAVARQLQLTGRVRSGYSDREPWREKSRQPIKTRVVEETLILHRRVINREVI